MRASGLALCVVVGMAGAAHADAAAGEKYIPGIWIDPDGCEHWAMDDGVEGFMSPRLRRDGTPVCHQISRCGVVPSDQFFSSNGATVSEEGKARLRAFFDGHRANGFVIEGHTDNRGGDAYNMALSERRARAVAAVAEASGARVYAVRGFGERRPAASNTTVRGRAQNRRVEILCLK